MKKIEFKDLPDTSTPLNAYTFNTMQNNIEIAINLLERKIKKMIILEILLGILLIGVIVFIFIIKGD